MKRSAHTILLLTVPLLAAAAVGAGCSRDFPPYNRLTDLRVLGIRSDPATPAPGVSATWSALVYTPPGYPAPSYEWSWCPLPGDPNDGYRCPITAEELAAMIPQLAGQVSSFSLGTDAEAILPNFVDPVILTALCTGTAGRPAVANCDNGFPFQISLTVRTSDGDPQHTGQVDAVTTGRWALDATISNANPPIGALNAILGEGDQEISDTAPVPTLPRDVATALKAEIPREAAESYDGFTDDRKPMNLTERLFMTWFVETGGTDDSRTSFTATQDKDAAEDDRRFGNLQKNTWAPALKKDYAPDTARLYVVIHDNRGGVSWKSGTVNLESQP